MTTPTDVASMLDHSHIEPALDAPAFVQLGGLRLAPDAALMMVVAGAWLIMALGLAWLVLERRGR